MSDSPWGPPPPSEDPYAQNPYAQNPQAQNPQAQDPYAGAPYGGQPSPYDTAGRDPEKRPGTVTAAGIITLVTAGLGALLFAIATAGLVVARDTIAEDIRRQVEDDPAFDSVAMPAADDLAAIMVVVMAVLLVWSLVACVLAVLAMRRSNVARVLLVVSAGTSALLSLVAILSLISAVPLVASVAVVVLLFTGGAGDWYARRG